MTGVPAPRAGELPGGAGPITPSDYLDFLAKEYLAGYVGRGGAAIKLLVVAGDPAAAELADGLATLDDGFVHATVDAATTKVHMIDQLFFAVARQVDWTGLAAAAVRAAYDRVGFPAPDPAGDGAGSGAGDRDGGAAAAVAGPTGLRVANVAASVLPLRNTS